MNVSDTPIPVRLTVAIAGVAVTAGLTLLWLASRAPHWGWGAALAVLFSFSNNTVFSLLHEAVHDNFHPERRINDAAGALFAAMFPTGFTIQRTSHLGHHRRNRTDLELFDYYLPHQSRWLKTYRLYCLLTGFYWSIIPVAGLLYLLAPWMFAAHWFQAGPARFWGFEPMVRDIAAVPKGRVWPEVLFTVVFQLTVWQVLDLHWQPSLACYWAFALSWSALQYVDHAWSPRHVTEGAWNLHVNPLTQALFLNYHCHLEHHRRPWLPWLYLPRNVDPAAPRPSFWSIYLSLWGGARPAPPNAAPTPLPHAD
jgi:fatty acid desaturase